MEQKQTILLGTFLKHGVPEQNLHQLINNVFVLLVNALLAFIIKDREM